MGCGSSSQVIPSEDANGLDAHKMGNGNGNTHSMDLGKDYGDDDGDGDDLSTVVLPDSPVTKKPPIAFEIPLEDADRKPRTPPPHLQRLMNAAQPDITRTDIDGKLAEAEMRRQMILQQRAASAQRRTQKMMRSLHNMEQIDIPDPDDMDMPTENLDKVKLPGTNMHIPNARTEGKNI